MYNNRYEDRRRFFLDSIMLRVVRFQYNTKEQPQGEENNKTPNVENAKSC